MPDNLAVLLPYMIYIIPTILAIFVLINSIVIVGGVQIAVLERRWLGRSIPEGRVVWAQDYIC